MHQHATSALGEVTLTPCQAPPPVPVVTTAAPVRGHQSLYLAARECLNAVNAGDGSARWCQQVNLIRLREVTYHPWVSYPPPSRVKFGRPRVVNGVVYVSAHDYDGYTYALNASDGSLRWRTPTDATVISMPFMDWAVPLVQDGIVYSGTFALHEPDGSVLWRVAVDTHVEGALAVHAVTDETLFATTHMGIYAINAQDGHIRWRYQPAAPSHVSGPPVVADGLLYAGTNASVGYPLKGHLFALDGETGAEVWRYPMVGGYIGAVADHARLYIHSGDGTLSVWDRKSGTLRWRHQFAAPGQYSATIANDVLYSLNTDGAYALNSEDGAVLWHESLGRSPGVSFTFVPSVVLDGAVYVVRLDNHGQGVLHALDTRTGAECWHTPYPSSGALLAVAQ